MHIARSLLLLIFISALHRAEAKLAYSVRVAGYEQKIELNKAYLSYWENASNKKISERDHGWIRKQFQPLPAAIPNFGFIKHDVWFHFSVRNNEIYDQVFYLTLSNPNLDVAELMKIIPSDATYSIDQGDLIPFDKRRTTTRKIAFKLEIPSHETSEFFLRVNNGGEQFHFSAALESGKHFFQQESNEHYYLGIYIGLLIFVIIFNFFMWLITRERISIHYTLYLLTFLFLQLSLLGFGKQYLWKDNLYLVNHANPFFASLSVYFLLRFSRIYLELKTLMPRIDQFFRWLQYLLIFTACISLIPSTLPYTVSILAVNTLTLFLNLLILPVAINAIRKGYQPAILFLIAFFLLVVSVFAFVLKNFGVLPSNYFTDYGFQFGSTAEVILFSLGIVIRFRNFREDAIKRLQEINELKEKANIELEIKVEERTAEIARQKLEIEEKNGEILSSIAYAKRIQEAILPESETIQRHLPDSSILYLPKDIVAGDFYWISERSFGSRTYLYFAVGDCTGHGVPGAMMSVLCTNALNEAVELVDAPGTAILLEQCNNILSRSLSLHSNEINDGMDISLCCLVKGGKEVTWSGANRELWLLRNGEISEYTGTKRPIGKSYTSIPFEETVIQLAKNDRLILFTDGIVDQFGGPSGKKFKKSGFRSALTTVADLNPEDQVIQLRRTLMDWIHEQEQIDDVTVWIIEIAQIN